VRRVMRNDLGGMILVEVENCVFLKKKKNKIFFFVFYPKPKTKPNKNSTQKTPTHPNFPPNHVWFMKFHVWGGVGV